MDQKYVLLVEDDSLLSESLSEHLSEAGFMVTVAKTAEEGVAAMMKAVPDIVVTDVTLPGMDGITFATAVRNNPSYKDIPIIILTNNDDNENLARAMILGVTTYILKADHSLSAIVDTVKEKIGGSEKLPAE